MVAIAGTLSLSLVVTTPSNAHALVEEFAVSAPVIAGATRMAIPTLMATSSILGPVGWTIVGVGLLGVGLWATHDYWWPYVTGAWGAATGSNSTEAVAGEFVSIDSHLAMAGGGSVSGNNYMVGWTYDGAATTNGSMRMHYKIKCTTSADVPVADKTGYVQYTYGKDYKGTTAAFPCAQSTYKPVGIIIGAANADPDLGGAKYMGPHNIVRFGTMNTADPGFDPRGADTKYETDVECIRPDGSKFTVTKQSVGTDGALKVAACEASSSGSHGTGKLTVRGFKPGDTSTTGQTIWSATAPTVDPAMKPCSPGTPGSGCKLAVKVDGVECLMGLFDCEHWTDLRDDPAQSSRVSCQYGPYAVAIETCNPLERAYEEGGSPATEENTDGNPATRKDTDPNGNQVPKPSPVDPSTIPGGAASGVPSGSTTEQGECFPTGWGMANPVEWVMKPVGCALDAAFKPKTDVQTRLSSMQTKFSTKVPVTWFGGNMENVSGGACPTSWAIDVAGQHVSLICGTPAEGIILAFRPVLGAMLIVAALWPLIRSLFYAAIPILKVNPS